MAAHLKPAGSGAVLFVATVVGASACAPASPPSCFTARPETIATCTAVTEDTLSFVSGEPADEFEKYCESDCLDVNGAVVISGYARLADVPLLAKMRHVFALRIYVDTLSNLEGLESIESVVSLGLRGSARRGGEQPAAVFSSLRGLRTSSLTSLSFMDTFAVFSGSELREVEMIDLENVAGPEVDVSEINPTALSLSRSPEVARLRLGAGPMTEVTIERNAGLKSFEWPPALRVSKAVWIETNPELSSCRVLDFANDTRGSRPIGNDTLRGNGPCP